MRNWEIALRDLGISIASAVLGILLPDVAAHGVFGTHLPDVKTAVDAGATAALLWAVAWITPLTRRYGVGSTPVAPSATPAEPVEPITALRGDSIV